MENTPTGTTPLTTEGAEEVNVLQEQLAAKEREVAEVKESLLRANRAIEAGKKFEKFEDFVSSVTTELSTLKSGLAAKDKDIEDLKSILATRSAVTPNINSQPSTPQPAQQLSEDEMKTRQIFGLPVTK